MRTNGVRSLLMGGQACVLYGGAEFSRDTDLIVLGDPANLGRLERALAELQAERIAVPPFEPRFLDMGLAVHFRCGHPEARSMRVDVMTRLRGVDEFESLWERRTTFHLPDGSVDALSLEDLVAAKKTQRDKDWPMVARLVDASFLGAGDAPTPQQVRFWLRELRTPRYIIDVAAAHAETARIMAADRPAVAAAIKHDEPGVREALRAEEQRERAADALYWAPLRAELSRLRRERGD